MLIPFILTSCCLVLSLSGLLQSRAEPLMTPELMDRLIARVLTAKNVGVLEKQVSGMLGLNDGTVEMPAKQLQKRIGDVKHVILVLLDRPALMFFLVLHEKPGEAEYADIYVTDRSTVLRHAMVADVKNGLRRLSLAEAQSNYQAELKIFAAVAAALPPPGNLESSICLQFSLSY
jgi:hypothetical protein